LREKLRLGFRVSSHASATKIELIEAEPLVTIERDFTAAFSSKQVLKGGGGRKHEGFADLRKKLNWTGVERVKIDVELLRYLEQSCAMKYSYLSQSGEINSAVQRLLRPIMITGDPSSDAVEGWFIQVERKHEYRDWVKTQKPLHANWLAHRRTINADSETVFIDTFRHFACRRMLFEFRTSSMTHGQVVPSFQPGH
jgi:hypothetical protein